MSMPTWPAELPKLQNNFAKDLPDALVYTCKDRMKPDDADVPDGHLVSNAQAGDARSFEQLFDRYYAMIHAFAYRVCLVETEADDLAQETFIRAARGIAQYRGTASFKNWLYRIAHNAVVDWSRQVVRRRDRDAGFALELETAAKSRPANYESLHAALRQLSPDLREAVALVFFEEMNHREAADALGCAETTVSWRIFRARRVLKKLLAPKENA
jgi:RNA polymerase sigma-70 factor, ECF subfamily